MNRFVNAFVAIIATASVAADLSAAPLEYTHGHGDVRVYYDDGQLKIRYQLDGEALVDGVAVNPINGAEPVSFELGQLVAYLPDSTIAFPAELLDAQPELHLLGAQSDEPLWYIPEVQELDRPWLGFSSEEMNPSDWLHPITHSPGELKLDLLSVSGPPGSHFSVFYNVDAGNPTFIHFATFDGIDENDTYKLGAPTNPGFPVGSHSHTNWSFTQPGFYDVTLRFSGEHVLDGYKEVIGTVHFAVAVPEPITANLMGAAILVAFPLVRRQRGAL